MAHTLPKTTPPHTFYRFVRSLPLKASSSHVGSNTRCYTGAFSKADSETPQTLTLIRFQPKVNVSSLGGCYASLSVNKKPFHGIPFTTVNITPQGKYGTNDFAVWSKVIPTQVAVSAEQVLKVPEEELLRSLDDDYIHKRADTRDLVKSHFDVSSGDAGVEILQVSLVCPLSRKRMTTPCRGVDCRHVQCFDAYAYLAVNENTLQPSWRCPLCELELPVEDMRVDLLTLHVLGEAGEYCDDVRLFASGDWESVEAGNDHSVILIEDSPAKTALQDVFFIDLTE